jgi:hypothetical protein
MSSVITCKVGNHIYLYESESYRDENGKVRNRRRCVGKVDPVTGKRIYKPEYIKEKGLHITEETSIDTDIYSVADVKHSVVKEYGVFYLLNEISKTTGLTAILAETMPAIYEDILSLAFYIVSTGEPAMYCEDWLYKTECYPGRELSSQRISELMAGMTNGERMSFFERWGEYRCEKEYVALDITSISTYSELINDAEWGYNRDKEKLPQINVCMLMGEKSRLPILQVIYSGSLKDVSTLRTTLETASGLNLSNMALVMDKGFAKIGNINAMLSETSGNRFVIALPFNMGFAKDQVKRENDAIDSVENTIVIGSDVLRGATSKQAWTDDCNIFVHACFNPEAATYARNALYAKVYELMKQLNQDMEKHRNSAEVKKYLTIRKSKNESIGYSIKIKNKTLEAELLTKGWVILISNHVSNAQEALHIYRAKDVVEKGFLRMKACLDLARLRVHSDEAMQNKVFVGFIALIITAHIHKIMADNQLYKTWTMKKMIKILERLKIHYIKNDRIISLLTKDQKRIFTAFDIKFDSSENL